jgi:FlaA1/EpsC-like NDP-sugar epimerase
MDAPRGCNGGSAAPPVKGSAANDPDRSRDRRGVRRAKAALRIALDLGVLSGAIWLAFLLRFEGDLAGKRFAHVLVAWPLIVGVQYLCFVLQKVPRFSWSLIGMRETLPILRATFGSAAAFLVVRYGCSPLVSSMPVLSYLIVPASVIVIDAILALLGILGIRTLRRLQVEGRRRRRRVASESTRTLLIGAGRAGSMVARDLELHPELGIEPVGFLDDEPALRGMMVNGIPVLGSIEELPRVAARLKVEKALITIAALDGKVTRRILAQCDAAGIQPKIIPRVGEILAGKVSVSQIRDVAIEDLLGRESVVIEDSAAPAAVAGKVVLVTGAGGSIGSELCRQILEIGPESLILVEQAEHNLYEIHRELAAVGQGVRIVPAIADICDAERMNALFELHRPHAVFHAAAHKHVPMMEFNPGEAVKNNFFGTRVVAALAQHYRSERYVLISTDKAVNPTSVMGATKRLAELFVQALNGAGPCRFVSVRFGNVLSSAGSVIPLFREQIARRGPVTVTHPEMERFFMTIPEASRLVLEAAGVCKGGEVMVLDMGEPIRIVTLAEQMIRLSGYEPGVDIEIVYTGMRPGEKLHEELAHPDEMLEPTRVEKIFIWRGRPGAVSMTEIISALGTPSSDPDVIRARLASVLPEYRGGPSPAAPSMHPVTVERLPRPVALVRAAPNGSQTANGWAPQPHAAPRPGDAAAQEGVG